MIPQEDIPALQSYKLDCDEKSARLSACQLTGADLQVQLNATNAKLTATAEERDTWKATAKGGTKWQRFKAAAKYIGIGVATGAAIGYATHK